MKRSWIQIVVRVLPCVIACAAAPLRAAADEKPAAPAPATAIEIAEIKRAEPVDFAKDVLPILRQNCTACHNAKDREADLSLETPELIRKGGETGPAVVAGKAMESLLLQVSAKRDKPFMPPKNNKVGAKPLTPDELGLIKLWIDQGAKGGDAAPATSATAPVTQGGPIDWQPLPEGLNPIYAIAVTNDAQLAACNRANQIFVYGLPRRTLLTRLTDPALQASLGQNRPGVAHRDLVQSLAFSPDGKLLASGGYREVKLWQRTDPFVRFSLPSVAMKQVNALATSPDGKTLAVASDDPVIRLFDLPDGKPKGEIKGHAGEVTSLAFSDDGAKLISGSTDKTARVWNVADGAPLARVDTPNAVRSVLALRGKSELLTAGGDNTVRRWAIPEAPKTIADIAGPITALATSPDRKRVAVAGADNAVRGIDVAAAKSEVILPAGANPIRAIDFDAEAKHLLAADAAGGVRVRSLADANVQTFTDPGGTLTAAALRPDARQAATATGDSRVMLWRLDAPASRRLGPAEGAGADSTVTAMAVSPNNQFVALATARGGKPTLVVRKIADGAAVQTLAAGDGPITAIAFSPDNARVLAGGAEKVVRAWSLADGKEIAKFAAHAGAVTSIAIHADNARAVSASADGGVKLWSITDGKEARSIPGHAGAVVGIAMLPKDQLVTASADQSLSVFDLNTGAPVRSTPLGAPATALAVSRDGERIAVSTADKSIRLINVDGAVALKFATPVAASSLSFSLDGKRLVASGEKRSDVFSTVDGTAVESLGTSYAAAFADKPDELIVADEAEAASVVPMRFAGTLSGITKPVTRLLYAKDGSSLLVASQDGIVRAFNPADGVARYAAVHGTPVRDLALSPDGATLASAGEDRVVKLWATATGAPAAPKPQVGPLAAPVAAVTFSADGARVIAASTQADDVVVFDREQGTALERCAAHAGQPTIALAAIDSPKDDGDVLLSASSDKSVRTFRTARRGQFDGHTGVVTSLASVPNDPARFLSGSADGTVRQWTLTSANPERQFAHGGPVSAVAVRADGKFVASAGGTFAKLFDFASAKEVATLKGDRGAAELAQLAERQTAAAQAEVAIAQQQLDAATQGLAAATQAVTKTTEAKAAAEKAVPEKQAAVTAKQPAKDAADKVFAEAVAVVASATIAQQAAEKAVAPAKAASDAAAARAAETSVASQKRTAEGQAAASAVAPFKTKADAASSDAAVKAKAALDAKAAGDSASSALAAAEKAAAEAKAAADRDPANEALRQAAEAAAKAVVDAAAKSKAALEAAAGAQKSADEANAAATAATQALAAAQKSADDAVAGARLAALLHESAQKLATDLATAAQKANEAKAAADAALAQAKAKQADAEAKAKPPAAEFAQAEKALSDAKVAVTTAEQAIAGAKAGVAKADQDLAARKASHALATSAGAEAQVALDVARKAAAASERTVRGVAFSPDGASVILGDDEGVVRTYAAETGAAAEVLRGHANAVSAVAVAPDGTILSGSADRTVKAWDANPAWTLKATIGTGDDKSLLVDRVLSLAFSPDGTLLATGGGVPSRSGELKLWSVATGQLFRDFTDAHSDTVYGLSFSGDGKLLASGAADKFAKVWDVQTGKLFRSFEGHTHHVLDVSLRYDGRVLASAGGDNALKLWNVQTGEQLRANAAFSKFEATSVAHVGFTDRFVATSGEGVVRVIREADLGVERAFDVPGAFIYAGAATPDGTMVFSGGYDSVLRIRDARDGKVIADLAPPK